MLIFSKGAEYKVVSSCEQCYGQKYFRSSTCVPANNAKRFLCYDADQVVMPRDGSRAFFKYYTTMPALVNGSFDVCEQQYSSHVAICVHQPCENGTHCSNKSTAQLVSFFIYPSVVDGVLMCIFLPVAFAHLAGTVVLVVWRSNVFPLSGRNMFHTIGQAATATLVLVSVCTQTILPCVLTQILFGISAPLYAAFMLSRVCCCLL